MPNWRDLRDHLALIATRRHTDRIRIEDDHRSAGADTDNIEFWARSVKHFAKTNLRKIYRSVVPASGQLYFCLTRKYEHGNG